MRRVARRQAAAEGAEGGETAPGPAAQSSRRRATSTRSRTQKTPGGAAPPSTRYAVLALLLLQNAGIVLVMKVSLRSSTAEDDGAYLASSAVLVTELCKLAVSLVCLVATSKSPLSTLRAPPLTMSLPALLYSAQNNLLYLAIACLDTSTFQITYQLKIIATALFSMLLLGRRVARVQWIALLLLMAGVTLVQWQSLAARKKVKKPPRWALWWAGSAVQEEAAVNAFGLTDKIIGLVCVVVASALSGFAGCTFELLLKGGQSSKRKRGRPSIWQRNIELGVFACVFSLATLLVQDFDAVRAHGFFQGYDGMTWAVIAFQAAGGILVSLVVAYTDSILKGYATSLSIVVSGVAGYLLGLPGSGNIFSAYFVLGAGLVIASIVLYSSAPARW